MDGVYYFAVTVVAAILVLSAYVTQRIVRDDLSARGQKLAQIVLVWILPVIGPILVLYLHRDERFEKREYQISGDEPFGGFPPEP